MNSERQELQRKPYMTIGWVRHQLLVLDSEIAAEEGRWKGYQNARRDQKWKVRLYLIIFGVVGGFWWLVRTTCIQLMRVALVSGKADENAMLLRVPSMIFSVADTVMQPVTIVLFIAVLRVIYVLWKNSDHALAKSYCNFFHMESLSEQIFQTELLIMRYQVDKERLLKIREEIIKEEQEAKEDSTPKV